MFRVELDEPGRALAIGYAGKVSPEEADRCAEEVRLALGNAQPGFRLVVDLTDLETMDVACSPFIGRIMEMCNASEVSEVVRIIPDPRRDIGLQIMSPFHYATNVRIVTLESAAEMMNLEE